MLKNRCYRRECTKIRNEFNFFSNRKHLPMFEGNAFCSESCLWTYFEKELQLKWKSLQIGQNYRIPRPRLGTILMKTAFITREQLDEAIRLQNQEQKGRIGEWLLRLGFVEEHQITAALAQQFGLPLINLKNSNPTNDAVRMVPGKVAKCAGFIPVGFDDNQTSMRIAVSGPVGFHSQEAIRRMVHKGIEAYVGDESTIQQLLEKWYDPEDLDLVNAHTFSSLEDLIDIGSEIISTAVKQRALDIQAELGQEFFWARLDYDSESHHYFHRIAALPTVLPESLPMGKAQMAYATTQ
jgi:hypothetical protein